MSENGKIYQGYVWFLKSTNEFIMFGCLMEITKENQISLKLVRNLYIFKLFNFYINELK